MKRATKDALQDRIAVLENRDYQQTRLIDELSQDATRLRKEKQADLEAMRQALDALRAAQSLIPEIEREKADLARVNATLTDQLHRAQELGSSHLKLADDLHELAAQRGTEIRILIEKINQLEAG